MTRKSRKRRGWWWKIPLGLLAVVILLVAVAWFRLSAIATWAANNKLPDLLNAEVSVGRIDLQPARGVAAIHDLRIGQPPGFGDDALVELDRVMARIDLKSLRSPEGILIRDVELKGLTAHVVKDADGALNLMGLVPPAAEAAPEDQPAEPGQPLAPAEAAETEAKPSPIPGIRIQRMDIDGVAVNYTDRTAGARPIAIAVGNLGVVLADGRVSLGEAPTVMLGEGTVTVEGIHIAQPDDFGEDALLELPRIQLDLGSKPFAENTVRLDRLAVEGLRAHILRNTNGVLNVARLGGGPPPPSPVPGDEVDTGDGEEAAAEVADADAPDAATASAPPAPPPVGVHLGALELTDFAVTYTDAALGKTGPVEFVVKDLGLRAKDLMAFLPEPPTPAASVDFSAALAQGENPDACLALVAALGPIGTGIPELNAQARLTGLLLDTLGDLVPSGVRQGLGANGVDLQTGVALNPSSIDLAGVLETDAGHSYPLMVKGPLDKPAVDLGPLMFAVAGRVVGGVANVAEGAAGAATDVAAGVTEGARELRKGVTGVVGSIGGGLLKSATGAMKGDLDQVTEGLTDATTRTAQGAAAAVGAAGGKVAAGVADGADSATGAKRATDWRDAIAARHEEGVAAAREALAAMPFPPPGVVAETTAP